MSKVILGDYKDCNIKFVKEENCYCIISEGSGVYQRLIQSDILLAYYCGSSNGAFDVRDIFVKFKFGDAKCVINLDDETFEKILKDVKIQN